MQLTRETLLDVLPPYTDQWVLVKDNQEVSDIITEILTANDHFKGYYDALAPYFWTGDIRSTCEALFGFCKRNIKYQEETDVAQTSALPTGLLHRGFGDCKHFSLFIGGVLGAIERVYNEPVNWCFCFASYKIDQRTPYHVFVVCEMPDGGYMWVDPTPGASGSVPVWVICKRGDGSDCNEMVTRETGTVGKVGNCGCSKVGSEAGYSNTGEGLLLMTALAVAALLLL